MKGRKKEGEKDRSTLGRVESGLSRLPVGCNAQYSTSVRALQEEVTEKFFPKKKRSLVLGEMYGDLGLTGRRARVDNCGTFLEFYVAEQEKKLHGANFCRDRFCPMCNWRRSMKIFSQTSQIMDVLEKRGYRFLFLTLTVKNCAGKDYPATIQAIYDGWRVLYHDYFCKAKALKSVILGTFRSLETTINKKTSEFHPHLHVILAVLPDYFRESYIKQSEWAEMWRAACGLDYKPIVDIRTIKPKKDKRTGEMSIAGAVAEVSKYAAKDEDYLTRLEDEDGMKGQLCLDGRDRTYYLRVLLDGLTGRRLVDMTGCFRKVKKQLGLDDVEGGDLVYVDGDTIREDLAYLIVRYQWRNGVYVESFARLTPEQLDKVAGKDEM